MVQPMKVGMREDDFLADMGQLAAERARIEAALGQRSEQTKPAKAEQASTTSEKLRHIAASIVKVLEADDAHFSAGEKQALLYRIIAAVFPTDSGADVRLRVGVSICDQSVYVFPQKRVVQRSLTSSGLP